MRPGEDSAIKALAMQLGVKYEDSRLNDPHFKATLLLQVL